MKILRMLLVASLLAGYTVPALALEQAQPQQKQAPAVDNAQPRDEAMPAEALAGEYSLSGVMETGSGLLLRGDGSFEWHFSYGALDLGARGTWSRKDRMVELVVVDMSYPEQFPQAKFERMQLRIDDGDLVPAWPWDLDGFRNGGERGRYVRH